MQKRRKPEKEEMVTVEVVDDGIGPKSKPGAPEMVSIRIPKDIYNTAVGAAAFQQDDVDRWIGDAILCVAAGVLDAWGDWAEKSRDLWMEKGQLKA